MAEPIVEAVLHGMGIPPHVILTELKDLTLHSRLDAIEPGYTVAVHPRGAKENA